MEGPADVDGARAVGGVLGSMGVAGRGGLGAGGIKPTAHGTLPGDFLCGAGVRHRCVFTSLTQR